MSVARDSISSAQCLWGYMLAGLLSAVGGSPVYPPLGRGGGIWKWCLRVALERSVV